MASLIVYFSRPGGNWMRNGIEYIEVGNTKIAAEILQQMTGADIFEIEPVTAFSDDYRQCCREAEIQLKNQERPALKALPESIDAYDTIYVGYPNFCGTMPMPICTFLDAFDITGKTIKPFCTHEGSGMGVSERDLKKLYPQAVIAKGLPIRGHKAGESAKQFKGWI